jgi:cation diffusion facilitator CzcD-associated flavoprotein CzcO
MPQLPKVAIIGAGSSGIAAAKALHERGVPFDCFEASDRVGGNWVFDNKNGMSAAYRDLHINTSRDRMQFSDFPMPATLPDFPHHTDIAAYFDAYVERFGFRDRILFETAVQRAVLGTDGTWELTDQHGVTRRYDMLLVANGHHWDPRWPEPPFAGSDAFEGRQLHAHSYRDNEFLRGKDVVVLGMGNSAMDIAVESSQVARSTQLAARRGAWIVPKYLFGRPVDQLATNPHTPVWLASLLLALVLRLHSGPPERYGLQRPDHRLHQAHPTISGRILDRITHGAVTPRPNIERLGPDWVRFTDGTQVHADVVVYCTGYKISFPFFGDDFLAASDNRIALFLRVFVPAHPTLAFVGLIQPIGATMPIAEAQGRLLAAYLRGEYHLPSRARMLAAIRRADAAMRRRYVASQRHTIQVDFDRYMHDLERERRRGARRAARAHFALPVPARAAAGTADGRAVAA